MVLVGGAAEGADVALVIIDGGVGTDGHVDEDEGAYGVRVFDGLLGVSG